MYNVMVYAYHSLKCSSKMGSENEVTARLTNFRSYKSADEIYSGTRYVLSSGTVLTTNGISERFPMVEGISGSRLSRRDIICVRTVDDGTRWMRSSLL